MRGYLDELKSILDGLHLPEVESVCDLLFRAYQEGRTVFVFGNGGSAAMASHIVGDWAKETVAAESAKPFKVLSLTDNLPLITAWANDEGYESTFSGQMKNFIEPGDVAFALSTSGGSANVLKGLELARKVGATTVGLTGEDGGKMKALLDVGIFVPSRNTQQIQNAHLILLHWIFLEMRTRISGGQ